MINSAGFVVSVVGASVRESCEYLEKMSACCWEDVSTYSKSESPALILLPEMLHSFLGIYVLFHHWGIVAAVIITSDICSLLHAQVVLVKHVGAEICWVRGLLLQSPAGVAEQSDEKVSSRQLEVVQYQRHGALGRRQAQRPKD